MNNAQVYLPIGQEVGHKHRVPEKIGETVSESEAKARGLSPDAPFKSWSLFLMPEYKVPFRDPELVQQLKDAFKNLGKAIGPDNLSVWFVTEGNDAQPDWGREHPESVYDYDRAHDALLQLGLDTATGPYIVISLASPNHLSPGTKAFVARLTGVKHECYPQIVDSLAEYIRRGRSNSSWHWYYDSAEEVKIDIAKATCGSWIEAFKIGK